MSEDLATIVAKDGDEPPSSTTKLQLIAIFNFVFFSSNPIQQARQSNLIAIQRSSLRGGLCCG